MGRSPESSIISFSKSHDRSMGVRFHLLAAYLETGLRLGQALEKVPTLLPPRLMAMLKTGEETGDLNKVLPICRRLINDGVSHTQGAINYLVLVAFVFTPLVPVPLLVLRIFILPKWMDIFAGMGVKLPPLAEFVFGQSLWFVGIQAAMVALMYLCALLYIAGPRLSVFLKRKCSISILDRISYRIPWKRKRIQRDFSALLALLLDAEVPEGRAVQLAAQSTANQVFIERADRAAKELAEGVSLGQTMRSFDDAGEFQWRLKNGAQGRSGFMAALSGWLDALDAKAYQQEQAMAQLLTTGLVFFNGIMVGVTIVGIFQPLISLINEAVLW